MSLNLSPASIYIDTLAACDYFIYLGLRHFYVCPIVVEQLHGRYSAVLNFDFTSDLCLSDQL